MEGKGNGFRRGESAFILFLLFTLVTPLFTQDKVDPLPLNSSSLFSDTSVYDKDFHNRHFICGWNYCGETKKLDPALRINYQLSGFE